MTPLKIALLTVLLLLDVLVVTPALAAWGAVPGVDRAFWSLAIPLITSLIGGIAGKKKQPNDAGAQEAGFVGDEDTGGFNWGAAAPWLAGGGGAALGYMLGKKKNTQAGGGNDILNSMLAQQQARMQQNEPAQQALLSMATGMMPTYMKQPGGGLDQWQGGYEQRAQAARTGQSYAQPRTFGNS